MISTFTGVGNFVTDSRTLAFIREQAIGIYANGLKPNSVVHVYFDNKNVDAFVRPAGFDPTTPNPTIDSFNPVGTTGSALITNSDGSVAGIFYIPPGKFFVGDRQIVISDATSVASLTASSTTNASTFFHAFNYPLETTDPSIISPRPSDSPVSITSNRGSGTSATVDTTRFDPLCQSFYVGTDMANGQDGIYLSYINVYFQAKDINLGVSFDIRTMENGTPTTKIVPFSKVHLNSSQINTDPNALLATQIVFPSPVFLRSGYEYALSIIPDGASANCVVWTAVVGGIDVATNNAVVRNWGQGVLFTSSTGSTWTPIQNEYLKFDVYSAQFEQLSGTAVFVNADYEFLSVTNTSAFFTHGEWAYQQTANSTGTVSINTTSQIVNGTGTSFQTTLTSGQYIAVTNGSVSDVLLVQSVANNTQFTSANIPDFTSASANYQLSPCGKVELFDANKSELFLINSTATNSNFCFTANSVVIGAQSNANTTILSVKDKVINRFQPQIYSSSVHGSGITMDVSGVTSNYVSIATKSYDLGSTNIVLGNEQVVASKTNEILNNGGNKSLNVNLNLSSNSSTISPTIDLQSISLLAYKNKINMSTNKENTKNGESWSKAISQTITLAEGQDAEDIVVYIDAYRPVGSDIKIYAKILNSADTDAFDAKDWSELDKQGNTTVFSDPTNIYDYIEYNYTFKASPPSYQLNGVLAINTTNNYITGTNTNFVTDAPVNSIVKIWSDSTKTAFQIGSVTSVTNSTALTIDNVGSFNSSVAVYEFVTQPKTAFHNPNTGIVRYYGSSGSAYDSYRTFAIKTVLISNSSYQVPRVMDIRVIAMSV